MAGWWTPAGVVLTLFSLGAAAAQADPVQVVTVPAILVLAFVAGRAVRRRV